MSQEEIIQILNNENSFNSIIDEFFNILDTNKSHDLIKKENLR